MAQTHDRHEPGVPAEATTAVELHPDATRATEAERRAGHKTSPGEPPA